MARDDDRVSEEPGDRVRLPRWLRAESAVPVYIGVGVALAGFVLIVVAWAGVAGETQVYRQLPYVVSAGLTGLALVMVGLEVIVLGTRRRDEHERSRQMNRLAGVLEELEVAVRSRTRDAARPQVRRRR